LFVVGGGALLSSLKISDGEESYDQNDYLSELTKAYATMAFYLNHGTLFTLNELTSDEMVIPTRGGDWFDGGVNLQLHRHQYDANNNYLNNAWQNLYGGIVACNKQLFQYSKIPTAPAGIVAELRTLRAWYYYLLLDAFRNVPLIVDYFPASPGLPSSNTPTQIFNFIESEINAALPDLSTPPIYGRFHKSAAQALLAKLYINADVYIGATKWTEALAACEAVITSGNYNLPANYFTSFYANNNTSPEIIFQIPYDAVTLGGFNLGQMTLHYQSQLTFNLTAQPWNGYAAVEDFYNSFEVSDERRDQFLVGPQWDSVNNVALTDPLVEPGDPDGAGVNFTPFIHDITNAYRQEGARIYKWKYQQGATPDLNNDFGIFRYSDILLLKAEALLRTGDPSGALILVNDVRQRADLAPFGSVTLSDILAERGREFFSETWRRQDLIRFGAFNAAWWEKNVSDSHYNIFPIPTIQLQANPNLTQNPGY
jgi:hypothetical protein